MKKKKKNKEKENNNDEKLLRRNIVIIIILIIGLVNITWVLIEHDSGIDFRKLQHLFKEQKIEEESKDEEEQKADGNQEVDKVQYGTLDVELVDKDGNSLEGKKLDFIKKGEGEILWEPGATYQLQEVYVKNAGNLKLKYKLEIIGINGSEKLLEVIDWDVEGNSLDQTYELNPGEMSNKIIVKGHMREDAGNEYQKLSIDGVGIKVNATQVNNE